MPIDRADRTPCDFDPRLPGHWLEVQGPEIARVFHGTLAVAALKLRLVVHVARAYLPRDAPSAR